LSANRILKLVHDVMRQACDAASSSVANVLFQSARDCLEIFMSIVPMKFSEVIDATPRMGGVFFNDCLYIAHNTTLITHRYRADLGRIDEVLQNSAGFVDFIPRFRSVGEQCLRSHLEDQRVALSSLIRHVHLSPDGEESGGSSSTTDGQEAVVLNDEQSAERLRAHMERLSHQWLGVLQEDVYCRVMGHLLEGVLEQLMAPLLRADCISAEAGTEISRIFKAVQKIRFVMCCCPLVVSRLNLNFVTDWCYQWNFAGPRPCRRCVHRGVSLRR
jgi:centromere/kinetochore protein ZW10